MNYRNQKPQGTTSRSEMNPKTTKPTKLKINMKCGGKKIGHQTTGGTTTMNSYWTRTDSQ